MGRELDFQNDSIAVSYAIGVLAPGTAPPESLDEFVGVSRPGGPVFFAHTRMGMRERGRLRLSARLRWIACLKARYQYARQCTAYCQKFELLQVIIAAWLVKSGA